MEVFFMGYKNSLKLTRQSGAMFALLTTALAMIGTVAAETSLLREDDTVGASFWIATAMMFAANESVPAGK